MAAGGTFTPGKAKIRPGNYINFQSVNKSLTTSTAQGVVVIPLFNHSYGPENEFVEISSSDLSSMQEKLGYDILSDNENILLIREAMKVCDTIKAYVVSSSGKKATATVATATATAKYAGTRGNDIKVSITANVTEGFDVAIYLGNEKKYEYTSLSTVADLVALDCPYVVFTATDTTTALTANAGVSLKGGTDGTSTTSDFTTFLDALDHTSFTAVCLPIESTETNFSSMASAFITKIKYLRDGVGKPVVGVLSNYDADYLGIYNVTNAPIVDDVELTAAQVTAWVAALYAGSTELDNNTNKVYVGATGFTKDNILSHEQVEQAILNGEFVFTLSDDDDVVVEYDINSLKTLDSTQDESYKKGRVIRTFDAVATMLKANFPVGKYSSSERDYDVMDGVGNAILTFFEEEGALTNVESGDFAVDRSNSSGDTAYFNVAIQAVDSIVKSYFTISTR